MSAFFVDWIELNSVSSQRLIRSLRLWAGGWVAALVALVLGLAVDRRGLTIPLALLALFAAMLVGAFVFLATRSW